MFIDVTNILRSATGRASETGSKPLGSNPADLASVDASESGTKRRNVFGALLKALSGRAAKPSPTAGDDRGPTSSGVDRLEHNDSIEQDNSAIEQEVRADAGLQGLQIAQRTPDQQRATDHSWVSWRSWVDTKSPPIQSAGRLDSNEASVLGGSANERGARVADGQVLQRTNGLSGVPGVAQATSESVASTASAARLPSQPPGVASLETPATISATTTPVASDGASLLVAHDARSAQPRGGGHSEPPPVVEGRIQPGPAVAHEQAPRVDSLVDQAQRGQIRAPQFTPGSLAAAMYQADAADTGRQNVDPAVPGSGFNGSENTIRVRPTQQQAAFTQPPLETLEALPRPPYLPSSTTDFASGAPSTEVNAGTEGTREHHLVSHRDAANNSSRPVSESETLTYALRMGSSAERAEQDAAPRRPAAMSLIPDNQKRAETRTGNAGQRENPAVPPATIREIRVGAAYRDQAASITSTDWIRLRDVSRAETTALPRAAAQTTDTPQAAQPVRSSDSPQNPASPVVATTQESRQAQPVTSAASHAAEKTTGVNREIPASSAGARESVSTSRLQPDHRLRIDRTPSQVAAAPLHESRNGRPEPVAAANVSTPDARDLQPGEPLTAQQPDSPQRQAERQSQTQPQAEPRTQPHTEPQTLLQSEPRTQPRSHTQPQSQALTHSAAQSLTTPTQSASPPRVDNALIAADTAVQAASGPLPNPESTKANPAGMPARPEFPAEPAPATFESPEAATRPRTDASRTAPNPTTVATPSADASRVDQPATLAATEADDLAARVHAQPQLKAPFETQPSAQPHAAHGAPATTTTSQPPNQQSGSTNDAQTAAEASPTATLSDGAGTSPRHGEDTSADQQTGSQHAARDQAAQQPSRQAMHLDAPGESQSKVPQEVSPGVRQEVSPETRQEVSPEVRRGEKAGTQQTAQHTDSMPAQQSRTDGTPRFSTDAMFSAVVDAVDAIALQGDEMARASERGDSHGAGANRARTWGANTNTWFQPSTSMQSPLQQARFQFDGWHAIEMNLEDGEGSLVIRARRDDDVTRVNLDFSDPAIRQQAEHNVERLRSALAERYESNVDLSFGDNGRGEANAQAESDRRALQTETARVRAFNASANGATQGRTHTNTPNASGTANEWVG